VANAVGAAFAVLTEVYPRIDALLDFRLLYQRSDDAERVGETDPLADYRQTYLLALKAGGIRGSARSRPAVPGTPGRVQHARLRAQRRRDERPHRRIYYGIGINLSRLLSDTVFRGDLKGGRSSAGRTRSSNTSRSPGRRREATAGCERPAGRREAQPPESPPLRYNRVVTDPRSTGSGDRAIHEVAKILTSTQNLDRALGTALRTLQSFLDSTAPPSSAPMRRRARSG